MAKTKSVSFVDSPEVKEALDIIKFDDVESVKLILNNYFGSGIQIMDFESIPLPIRMSFIQKTPSAFIKSREVAGKSIPYIDHYFAEKCLNFVSNFNWGSSIVKSEIKEEEVQTKNGVKKAFDALVEMDFWIQLGGNRINRFICAGHRMFENPATTRADALKSAISKANTVFARQFGVGANIIDQEGKAYDSIINVMGAVRDMAEEEKEMPEIIEEDFNDDDFEPVIEEEKPKEKSKNDQDKEVEKMKKKTQQKLDEIKKEQLEKEAKKREEKNNESEKNEDEKPKKEDKQKKPFNKEKFMGNIAKCKTFDELNRLQEAFQAVNKQIEEFDIDDFSVKEIWNELKMKLNEIEKKGKEPADASDFDDLFK